MTSGVGRVPRIAHRNPVDRDGLGWRSQRTKQGRHANHKDDAGQRGAQTQKPLHEKISFGGIDNELEANEKPRGRVRSSDPRTVALVATDLAARLMPQAIRKSCANRKKMTKRACRAGNGQKRPVAWSESPQWVERIAPVGGAIRTTTYGGSEAIRPSPPRPRGSPPRLARPHRPAAAATGPIHRRRGPRP